MSIIPLISSVAPAIVGAVAGNATTPSGLLGKDDFLKLLVAQLKNQDPINPLDNSQFINQSAAFSSLEALQNIQKSLDNLAASNSNSLAGAAGLLGRQVTATAGRFSFSGGAVTLPYTITTPVASAALEVTDASGTVVSRQTLGPLAPGQYTAVFTPPAGGVLPAGDYRYRIVSMDGGSATPLRAVSGTVTGITAINGTPVLQVGSIAVNLTDVTTIGTPTN